MMNRKVKETAETLYSQYKNRSNKNRPLLIGIDGLGGAGKTSFIKELSRELKNFNCEIGMFHLDDHIVEKNKRYRTGYEEWYEYYYLQWDIEGLITNLLEPLHKQNHVILPFYNKSADLISTRQVDVLKDSIVLIEGIFLQRKEWRYYFDYVVFLNCPFEVRRDRVLHRDSYLGDYQARLKKYTERYWLGEQHYMETVQPLTATDLIITM